DAVAGGVDRQEPARIVGEAQCSLTAEIRAEAGAAGRYGIDIDQRAVRALLEHEHTVVAGCIGRRIDVVATLMRCDQQAAARERDADGGLREGSNERAAGVGLLHAGLLRWDRSVEYRPRLAHHSAARSSRIPSRLASARAF